MAPACITLFYLMNSEVLMQMHNLCLKFVFETSNRDEFTFFFVVVFIYWHGT